MNVSELDLKQRGTMGTEKVEDAKPIRSCNRHNDCDKAEEEVLARNPGKTRLDISLSFHCHDEACEDCFGY